LPESEVHRLIKLAIAKVLVELGYFAGVEFPRPGGGFLDVYGRKGNNEINVEIWKTNLPEWLIVRVKEEVIPLAMERGTEGNSNVELSVTMPRYGYQDRLQKQRQQLTELYYLSQTEIPKLTAFVTVFNTLSGRDRMDVREDNLIIELMGTGEFDDASMVREYIMKAMEIGIIYRRKPDLYAKI
jgi:hypothetical protein